MKYKIKDKWVRNVLLLFSKYLSISPASISFLYLFISFMAGLIIDKYGK